MGYARARETKFIYRAAAARIAALTKCRVLSGAPLCASPTRTYQTFLFLSFRFLFHSPRLEFDYEKR